MGAGAAGKVEEGAASGAAGKGLAAARDEVEKQAVGAV